MTTDRNGYEVSTESHALVEDLDRFATDFLAAREDAGRILDVAERNPDCALAQAYAAAMHLYSQSRIEIERDALPLLRRASDLRPRLTARESLLVDALGAWAANDLHAAIALHERIAIDWPRDLVAAKIAEFLFFEAPDYRRHLRFMERLASVNDDAPPFLAMHAFALELCREHERAERTARRAIELEPRTPWAHHALAHQMLNQRRIDESLALLEEVAPTWAGNTQTIRGHNWWHVALLHLASGDASRALDLLHERIAGFDRDSVFEHVDVISLLWRLELAGRRVDEEWRALAPRLVERAHEQCFPFLNAHYAYALTRAGMEDVVEQTLDELHAYALRRTGAAARTFRDVGLPLVTACAAFAAGEAARCVVLLEPVLPEIACVGGSDAQNDLFRQTYLVALLDCGRRGEARRRLDDRIGHASPTAVEQGWLARA
ncbi:MAG: tetratricopeptide repeat protein [Thermodesulfobacteriota bacterium]